MARAPFSSLRLSAPLLWVGAAVLIAAIAVQATGTGIDVLALLAAVLVLLVLERTLGDAIAESLGPTAATIIFAAVAVGAVLFLTSGSGRAMALRLVAAADARGYHALYFKPPAPKVPTAPAKPAEAERELATGAQKAGASARARGREGEPDGRRGRAGRADGQRTAAPTQSAAPDPLASAKPTGHGVYPAAPPVPKLAVVNAMPAVVSPGETTTLQARVVPVPEDALAVVFTVNGRMLSTARVDDGVATATFATDVPGLYTVRARLTGDGRYSAAESSTTINVVVAGR